METRLPMLYMQNILVLYSSTEVLSSQFSVYFKFIYLFIFILHIISKNYMLHKLFKNKLTLITLTLYCNGYVKVNRK